MSFIKGFKYPTNADKIKAIGTFPIKYNKKKRMKLILNYSNLDENLDDIYLEDINNEEYYSNKYNSFENLPTPLDEDSWLANYNEPGQSIDEYINICFENSNNLTLSKSVIYFLPIYQVNNENEITSSNWPSFAPDIKNLADWTSTFYNREVIILQPSYIYVNMQSNPNNYQTINDKFIFHISSKQCYKIKGRTSSCGKNQVHINGLLKNLCKIKNSRFYNDIDITNSISLIGITMADLYSHDTDLFVAGHAGEGFVGVLSFLRYLSIYHSIYHLSFY
jgi:hypothetical protein